MGKSWVSKIPLQIFFIFIVVLFIFPSRVKSECREFGFSGGALGWPANVEVLATIRIDTVVDSETVYHEIIRKVVFTFLSVSPVDTSIFTNAVENIADTVPVSYDTAGFPIPHIDSFFTRTSTSFTTGDTLRDMFIVQSYQPLYKISEVIAISRGCFLTESNPPFPLNQAILFFNGYLNDNKIYKGYSPPANGILKLGPVFNNFWAAGDPGWKLTAHNDSIYWYLNQHAGDGDCLMGCTGGMDATYRISSNGTVERVACTSYSYNPVIDYCSNASIREKKQPQLNRNFQGDLYVYDLTGRFLGRISSHQFKRGRSGMAHLKLKPGVYIFKPENETGQWLLRRMVY